MSVSLLDTVPMEVNEVAFAHRLRQVLFAGFYRDDGVSVFQLILKQDLQIFWRRERAQAKTTSVLYGAIVRSDKK